jgi:hypothetical protein
MGGQMIAKGLFSGYRCASFSIAAVVSVSVAVGAQPSARVSVTVTPAAQAGQPALSASGFSVCIGTSANRALHGTEVTSASGIAEAQFQDLPVNETVLVTVSKTGFAGKESTITLQPGRNNRVELSPQSGSGGPSCPGVSVGPPPATTLPPAPPPPTATATTVQAVTALTQQGSPGTIVQTPPAVVVRDQNNNPMQGAVVAFVITTGGGSVTPATRETGTDGIARLTSWTMGPTAGANSLVAKVTGLQAVSFSATAIVPTPPTATRVEAVTATSQQAPAGSAVPQPPGVRVRDQNGNPLQGVSVVFAIVTGGGQVFGDATTSDGLTRPTINRAGATQTTGADGTARLSTWVLGTTAGANTVTATAGTLPVITFSATGNAVPTASSVSALTTAALTRNAGATITLPEPLTVIVRDQNNSPLSGVSVAFAVTAGGGSITPSSTVTGSDGLARLASWTLGTAAGTNTVSATVAGLSPATLKINGALAATTMQGTSPPTQEGVVQGIVPTPPAVLVRDQFNNPLAGAPVTFAVTSGGGSITPTIRSTGADGYSRLSKWALGGAPGANTVTANVGQLPPVTFSAKALAQFTLDVFVKRADGTVVINAQICVGSRSDVDQYATVKSGGTYGRATFTLPGAAEYGITAAKAGYVGQTTYMPVSGSSGSATITIPAGTGGTTCPGMAVEYEGTTSVSIVTPVAPTAAPARLGEEPLKERGTFAFNQTYNKTLDCKLFGASAVMVGIIGKDGSGIDEIQVICQKLKSDGTLDTQPLPTERWDQFDARGDGFRAVCTQGWVVAGTAFTAYKQIRSITIHCKKLATNGLTSDLAMPLPVVGTRVSDDLGPDFCTSGRPARALRLSTDIMKDPTIGEIPYGPWIIVAEQLICEQPVKPLP